MEADISQFISGLEDRVHARPELVRIILRTLSIIRGTLDIHDVSEAPIIHIFLQNVN
jgi:hypothetical protein